MLTIGSDPRRLGDFQQLYHRITESDIYEMLTEEIDQCFELIGIALDVVSSAFWMLIEIYAYIKTLPPADDG